MGARRALLQVLSARALMRLLKCLLFQPKEGEDRTKKNTLAAAKLNTSDPVLWPLYFRGAQLEIFIHLQHYSTCHLLHVAMSIVNIFMVILQSTFLFVHNSCARVGGIASTVIKETVYHLIKVWAERFYSRRNVLLLWNIMEADVTLLVVIKGTQKTMQQCLFEEIMTQLLNISAERSVCIHAVSIEQSLGGLFGARVSKANELARWDGQATAEKTSWWCWEAVDAKMWCSMARPPGLLTTVHHRQVLQNQDPWTSAENQQLQQVLHWLYSRPVWPQNARADIFVPVHPWFLLWIFSPVLPWGEK